MAAERSVTLAHGTNHIESDRLVLRRIVSADLEFFTRIHGDPDVARYLGHGLPRSAEETRTWLDVALRSYDELALGPLAVIRKSDGAILGRCGLNDLAVEVSPAGGGAPRAWFGRSQAPPGIELTFDPELGYTFDASAWGHGYASEAARTVFDYGRRVLKLRRIVSIIHPANVRSLRLARKFDVRLEDSIELQGRVFDRYSWPIAT
jgi:ribosomal-protein-alanine N-acetyltransferase